MTNTDQTGTNDKCTHPKINCWMCSIAHAWDYELCKNPQKEENKQKEFMTVKE